MGPHVAPDVVLDAAPCRQSTVLGDARHRFGGTQARKWGNKEVLLEVAQTNVGAIRFYERLGYKVLTSDGRGTGAMQVDVRPFWWDVYPVRKYVMRRPV